EAGTRKGFWCRAWATLLFRSRRRHTRLVSDWSADVCASDLSSVRPPKASGMPEAGDQSCGERAPRNGGATLDERGAPAQRNVRRSEERRVGKEWRSRGGGEQ